MELPLSDNRRMKVDEFDSGKMLSHAARQAKQRGYDRFPIVDVDSHHYETDAFNEIAKYISDPVMRHEALFQGMARGGITSVDGSYQELAGRITRYPNRRKEKVPPEPHRDITLMHRWMDPMGVDIAVMFPTPMLNLAVCPRVELEVALAFAYNRWLCETVLDKDPRKVVEKAVWGMLPKNKLGRQIIKKLKVYSGPTHPHQAQKAVPFEITQISQ